MAKLLKLRRGSTSGHSSFTGAEGEVTIDTTKKTAVVHDGATAGGLPLAREDMNNVSSANIVGRLADDAIATSKIGAGALPTDVTVASANIVDGTIVSGDIADGTIVNADINASAAIAGSKVSPDFGSQNIATTGNASIGGTNLNMSSAYIDFSGSISAPTTAAAIYRPADNSLAISTGNNQRLLVNNSGASVTGNLDVSSGIDVTSGNITLADAGEIRLGASGDLQIYHDGNESYINDAGAGSLRLQTDSLQVRNTGNTANKFTVDTSTGQVNVTNNLDVGAGVDVTGDSVFVGDVKFQTAATGRDILFDRSAEKLLFEDNAVAAFGDSSDLQIYHDGSHSYIQDSAGTGQLVIRTNGLRINSADDSDNMITADELGGVKLFYADSAKLETVTGGVNVTGALTASGNVTAFSDSRLKTEIHTIKNPLEKVDRLRGVTFKWLHTNKPSSGVIAQEVQEVFPELVEATTHEGKEVLSVDYGKLVGVLIESIKELKAEFEAHKAECAKQHGGE